MSRLPLFRRNASRADKPTQLSDEEKTNDKNRRNTEIRESTMTRGEEAGRSIIKDVQVASI
jgi:hypothetical protein